MDCSLTESLYSINDQNAAEREANSGAAGGFSERTNSSGGAGGMSDYSSMSSSPDCNLVLIEEYRKEQETFL